MVIIFCFLLPNEGLSLSDTAITGILGARLFASRSSKNVGWIAGYNDPTAAKMLGEMRRWKKVTTHQKPVQTASGKLTIDESYQNSKFTVSSYNYRKLPVPTNVGDLRNHPDLLGAEIFHLVSDPNDIPRVVGEIIQAREQLAQNSRPRFIWEPPAHACNKTSQEAMISALPFIDVFSPTYKQFLGFFGHPKGVRRFLTWIRRCFNASVLREALMTELAKEIVGKVGPEGEGCLVIRAEESGTYLYAPEALLPHGVLHVPAYHTILNLARKVVDTTGAGSCFLGGFAMGMREGFLQGSIWGTVAASFAVEQFGLPIHDEQLMPDETWNGDAVRHRVSEFMTTAGFGQQDKEDAQPQNGLPLPGQTNAY